MKNAYFISVSGGASSAATLIRCVDLYPKEDIYPIFADTLIEHPTTYQFLDDLELLVGIPIHRIKTGFNPMDISDKQKMIFNSRVAKCTQELKTIPIQRYIETIEADHKYLCIGFNIKDAIARRGIKHGRLPAPVLHWNKRGIRVKYPLHFYPKIVDINGFVKSYGLTLPAAYALRDQGFNVTANCGGTCFKAGIKYWRDSIFFNPEQFIKWMQWETEKRKNPKFSKYSILRRTINGVKEVYPLEMLYTETLAADDSALRRLRMQDEIESDCSVECQVF